MKLEPTHSVDLCVDPRVNHSGAHLGCGRRENPRHFHRVAPVRVYIDMA